MGGPLLFGEDLTYLADGVGGADGFLQMKADVVELVVDAGVVRSVVAGGGVEGAAVDVGRLLAEWSSKDWMSGLRDIRVPFVQLASRRSLDDLLVAPAVNGIVQVVGVVGVPGVDGAVEGGAVEPLEFEFEVLAEEGAVGDGCVHFGFPLFVERAALCSAVGHHGTHACARRRAETGGGEDGEGALSAAGPARRVKRVSRCQWSERNRELPGNGKGKRGVTFPDGDFP